ncbi:hypothetical protein NPIL_219731 [Nephila pilipes]|uniref:Uncharacterized protein n=1 Tax=Nephila pilipes TaxID=299642 RepID=A0A8X6NAG6_NEPPI|nr:hypothetical protein NPIL_219731 [Nephila pilipes]
MSKLQTMEWGLLTSQLLKKISHRSLKSRQSWLRFWTTMALPLSINHGRTTSKPNSTDFYYRAYCCTSNAFAQRCDGSGVFFMPTYVRLCDPCIQPFFSNAV